MTRRTVVRGIVLGALGAISGLLPGAVAFAQEPRFDGVTLRVATWGGGHRDFIKGKVAVELEKRGAKVEFIAGSPAENLSKLIAARGRPAPFDLVEMIDSVAPDFIEGGFVQKIGLDNISNKRHLQRFQYDEFKVADWVTQEAIVYNAEKFKELGIAAPTKYSDLVNPKLRGKVIFPDVGSGGWVHAVVGMALTYGGSEANIDPGLTALKEQLRPRSFFSGSGDTEITEFKNGDIWAAPMHAGWAIQMHQKGIPFVKAAHAQLGAKRGMVKLGYWGVVKGSPAARAAEFFIDTFLSADVQEFMTKNRGLVAVNGEALKRLSGDPLLKENLLLSPEDVANVYVVDFSKVKLPEWTDKWNRMVVSK
ncbi:MAG TPA: extracellular solute-binding protein [Methylomirabilota bacterium]|jgi:putative spermidine/putrescine transport system substrate-binding protein